MLTKNDLKQISNLLKPLQKDISTIKTDLSSVKSDVSNIKSDISGIKSDISDMKTKINEFYDFTLNAFSHLFSWTDDVDQSLKIKRSKRVKKRPSFPTSS